MKEQELALENLQHCILENPEIADEALWKAIVAFQGSLFSTASGLPFWYTLKKSGSGELVVSRKEDSKTLTRSSVLYAFHIVREAYLTKASVVDLEEQHGSVQPHSVVPVRNNGAGKAAAEIEKETEVTSESEDVSRQGMEVHAGRRRWRKHAKEAPEWMLWQDMQAVLAEDRTEIPAYCGPKAIGQIFGISYIYSLFFRFGLIRIPKRVAEKMLMLIPQ